MDDKTNGNNNLSKFIAEKRKAGGMTQDELARKLFVTNSAVSKWERGVSTPDITLVPGLCEALGITEHEFFIAADDQHGRNMVKRAEKYERLGKGYNIITIGAYALTLIICFICNIAQSHSLDWWFIVFGSILTAFTLTNVPWYISSERVIKKMPEIFTRSRLFTVSIIFMLALTLLLVFCRVFVDCSANWLLITVIGLIMAWMLLVFPIVAPKMFPGCKGYRGFIVTGAEILLVFALTAATVFSGLNDMNWLLHMGWPITAMCALAAILVCLIVGIIKLGHSIWGRKGK